MLVLVATGTVASAQGLISFRSFERVRVPVDFGHLSGTNFLAQLSAAPLIPSNAPFLPVGQPVPLHATKSINGGMREVSNVPPNAEARLVLRVWYSENGTIGTYSNANLRAKSAEFILRLAGPGTSFPPPAIPEMGGLLLAYRPNLDPCDCEFQTLFQDSDSIGSRDNSHLLGVSGDGENILIRNSGYIQTPLGYSFRTVYLIRNTSGTSAFLASQNYFNPFDPKAPRNSEPEWRVVGLTFDGRKSLGIRDLGTNSRSFLLESGHEPRPISIEEPVGISGDGRYAVGRGGEGDWLRLNLAVSNAVPENIDPTGTLKSARFLGMSGNGEIVTWATESQAATIVQWHPGAGIRPLVIPGFVGKVASSDGKLIGGFLRTNVLERAATWSEPDGLRILGPVGEPSVILALSGDKSIAAGAIGLPSQQRLAIWESDGSPHSLDDLVRGLDLSAMEKLTFHDEGNSVHLSANGRRMAFTMRQGAFDMHSGFLARLAFPGEGPRGELIRTESGLRYRFIGKPGYSYQASRSLDLIRWEPFGKAVAGKGEPILSDPVVDGGRGFYRFIATPPEEWGIERSSPK